MRTNFSPTLMTFRLRLKERDKNNKSAINRDPNSLFQFPEDYQTDNTNCKSNKTFSK